MHLYNLGHVLDDIIKSERIHLNLMLIRLIRKELVYSKRRYFHTLYSEHFKVGDGIYRPMGLIKSIRLYIEECSVADLNMIIEKETQNITSYKNNKSYILNM